MKGSQKFEKLFVDILIIQTALVGPNWVAQFERTQFPSNLIENVSDIWNTKKSYELQALLTQSKRFFFY